MGLLVSLLGTCLGLEEIADWSPWMPFCGKHIDLPPPSPIIDLLFWLPASPQTTPVPFQPLLCPCHGQCILYEAVKFDDSFPCQCGPHTDPSVIYGTDPPAVEQPHYKWEKRERKNEAKGGESRWRNRKADRTGHRREREKSYEKAREEKYKENVFFF